MLPSAAPQSAPVASESASDVPVVREAGAAGAAQAGPGDEVLVELLRDGGTSAGEVLVKRYCEPLMRYLHRLAGNQNLAEELHQQTWASVLEHLDKFDPRSSPGGAPSPGCMFHA